MKKLKLIALLSFILASLSVSVSAISNTITDIEVQIRPDYIVKIDGVEQIFENANNEIVYPVVYEGTTYIPLRAIGEIMDKNIFFNPNTNVIDLIKRDSELANNNNDRDGNTLSKKVSDIEAQIRPDYIVKIDGVEQNFKNANNEIVYPIVYEGTTYIPLRAIGEIMDKNVFFHASTKTIDLAERNKPLADVVNEKNSVLLTKVDDKEDKGTICGEFTADTGNVAFTITESKDIDTYNVKLFKSDGGQVYTTSTITVLNGISFSNLIKGEKYYFEVSSLDAPPEGILLKYKVSQY